MKSIIFSLSVVITSLLCTTIEAQIIEQDDLYYSHKDRKFDTLKIKKKLTKYHYISDNTYPSMWNPYGYGVWNRAYPYGYPFEYYRSRTIVIMPRPENNYNYGKRPDRSNFQENRTPQKRQGRN